MKTSISTNLKSAGSDIVNDKNKQTKIQSGLRTPNQSLQSDHSTLNLSKIRYKNGCILKDASNSNPGYGLWCLNINSEKTNNSDNILKKEISNELSKNSLIDDKDDPIEKIDKMVIDQLKFHCEDLERKLAKALSGYYEKENLYINAEKMKSEYEELLNQSIEEKNSLQINIKKLEDHVGNLTIALGNAQKEILRLNGVIKSDEVQLNKMREEYENKLKEEKKEKEILNKNVRILQTQLDNYIAKEEMDSVSKKKNKNYNVNLSGNKNSTSDVENAKKLEFQLKKMKDFVLELQMQISQLKKRIMTLEEDKGTLWEIIKFKEKKNNFQKKNIDNLFTLMDEKTKQVEWDKNIIKGKSNTIQILRMENSDLKRIQKEQNAKGVE